jgi:hypothetical protein
LRVFVEKTVKNLKFIEAVEGIKKPHARRVLGCGKRGGEVVKPGLTPTQQKTMKVQASALR